VVIMAAKRAPAAEASLGVEMAAATSAAHIVDKTAPSSSPIPSVWAAPSSSSTVLPLGCSDPLWSCPGRPPSSVARPPSC
jgi:hypothetical protein